MLKMNVVDYIVQTLVVIGAINWGLVGFLNFDLVGALFGGTSSMLSRTVFALVGLAGLYAASFLFRRDRNTVQADIKPAKA